MGAIYLLDSDPKEFRREWSKMLPHPREVKLRFGCLEPSPSSGDLVIVHASSVSEEELDALAASYPEVYFVVVSGKGTSSYRNLYYRRRSVGHEDMVFAKCFDRFWQDVQRNRCSNDGSTRPPAFELLEPATLWDVEQEYRGKRLSPEDARQECIRKLGLYMQAGLQGAAEHLMADIRHASEAALEGFLAQAAGLVERWSNQPTTPVWFETSKGFAHDVLKNGLIPLASEPDQLFRLLNDRSRAEYAAILNQLTLLHAEWEKWIGQAADKNPAHSEMLKAFDELRDSLIREFDGFLHGGGQSADQAARIGTIAREMYRLLGNLCEA